MYVDHNVNVNRGLPLCSTINCVTYALIYVWMLGEGLYSD